MAGRTTIRELLVKIGVQTDKAKLDALDGAIGKVKTGLIAATGIAIGFGVALFKLAKDAADYGANAEKGAQRVGVSAQSYQELQYAAKKSGIEVETLEMALGRLSQAADKTDQGAKGMVDTFHRLGISVLDAAGKTRPTDVLLGDIAARFKTLPDGAEKVALSMAIFGRQGRDLIPFLNKGRDGIQGLRMEAQRLGLVLDAKGIKSAKDFRMGLKSVSMAVSGLKLQIGMALLPVLAPMLTRMQEWVTVNRDLIQAKVSEWVDRLQKGARNLGDRINRLVDDMGGWDKVMSRITTTAEILFGVWIGSKAVGAVSTLLAVGKELKVFLYALAVAVGLPASSLLILVAALAATVAMVGLVVLEWDDLITWLRGGQSVIGGVIAGWHKHGGVLAAVASLIDSLRFAAQKLGGYLADTLGPIVRDIADVFCVVADAVGRVVDKVAELASSAVGTGLMGLAAGINTLTGNTSGPRFVKPSIAAQSGPALAFSASGRGGGGSSVSQSYQGGNVTINGVGIDASGARDTAASLLGEQHRAAYSIFTAPGTSR